MRLSLSLPKKYLFLRVSKKGVCARLANVFTVIVALFYNNVISATELDQLEGSFFVSPKYYIDPSDGDKNTHYRIVLKGQSAKQMYQLMNVEVKKDHCTEAKSKTVGAMQCFDFDNDRGYECNFSIDIENQIIDFGLAC